jgi:hypothetical protein
MEVVTTRDLALKVLEMRKAQASFFEAARKGQIELKNKALLLSKQLESEVDRMCEQIVSPSKVKQSNLFL